MISHKGDIHHIFPRDYLKKNGLSRGQYNQITNYVYIQSEINIKISNVAPKVYFEELIKQCNDGLLKYGGIDDLDILKQNLKMNCIPEAVFGMDIENYEEFLKRRRALMAQKMKEYYYSL